MGDRDQATQADGINDDNNDDGENNNNDEDHRMPTSVNTTLHSAAEKPYSQTNWLEPDICRNQTTTRG